MTLTLLSFQIKSQLPGIQGHQSLGKKGRFQMYTQRLCLDYASSLALKTTQEATSRPPSSPACPWSFLPHPGPELPGIRKMGFGRHWLPVYLNDSAPDVGMAQGSED